MSEWVTASARVSPDSQGHKLMSVMKIYMYDLRCHKLGIQTEVVNSKNL